MTFKLVYTSRAKRDLTEATDYIAEQVPDTAERWFQGFVEVLSTLRENALVHALAPESIHVDAEIRQIIYRTKSRRSNRALYTVRGDTVYILCIRRPGQHVLNSNESRDLLDDIERT